jgi:hypothetical protein
MLLLQTEQLSYTAVVKNNSFIVVLHITDTVRSSMMSQMNAINPCMEVIFLKRVPNGT